MSEGVDEGTIESLENETYSFSVDSHQVLSEVGVLSPDDEYIGVNIEEIGTTFGHTAATPKIWLLTGSALRDEALPSNGRLTATNQGFAGTVDKAPAAIISATTDDIGGTVGRIDSITVGFSELVNAATIQPTTGTVPFNVDTGAYPVTAVSETTGNFTSVTLTVTEISSGYDTGAKPPIAFSSGTDANGIARSATQSFGGTADGALAVLIGATATDVSTTTGIFLDIGDMLELQFSENLGSITGLDANDLEANLQMGVCT